MGGDITGKMIVPIVDRGQGVYTATLYGRNLQVTGDGLAKLRKTITDAGYYAYEMTPEEMSLHGHIHESRGEAKIGRTLAINPGSEYSEGVLRGVIITLNRKKGVRGYQLVAG